ncbi:lysophospholipid acyltransferase family protein [Denitratimonas sp. CY0512]|uniref:lysophospholipid acyltransferase family protein n=1 Tax=Denitratimonas sp. CY0512 TaxID=3131940 RepID=UPI0030A78A15
MIEVPVPMQRDPLRPLRYVLRVPLLLLHIVLGLPPTLLLINRFTARWTLDGERVDHRVIRAWSGGLMRIFGFRVRRIGEPLRGAHLLVANHVSWIDIELVHSQRVVGFVAKAEIDRWPLIGWLASRAGTIYHTRGSNASLNGVLEMMVGRLDSGQAVGVFPEGGTTGGDEVRTFHARIFQCAFEAQVPVQPVALRYGEGGNAQTTVAFARGENFLQNFLRLLGEPGRVAEVHFLPPVMPGEEGRRRLAEQARERIIGAMAS